MNGNVTLSLRSILVAALVLLGLVVAYLLGGSGSPGAPAVAAEETAPAGDAPRVITMTGTGSASAVPDQLSFALSVSLTRPDLDTALDDANTTMSRVLRTLEKEGVAKSDVETTGLSMNPVYDYPEYGQPTIRGYQVSEHATVLVRELKDGGDAVSAAVSAGGNAVRVGSIRLLVAEPDAVMAEARDAAVAEATAKAEQYAGASGQELGEVLTLNEVTSQPLPTSTLKEAGAFRAADEDALSSVPIRAGKDEGSVTVEIVWTLS